MSSSSSSVAESKACVFATRADIANIRSKTLSEYAVGRMDVKERHALAEFIATYKIYATEDAFILPEGVQLGGPRDAWLSIPDFRSMYAELTEISELESPDSLGDKRVLLENLLMLLHDDARVVPPQCVEFDLLCMPSCWGECLDKSVCMGCKKAILEPDQPDSECGETGYIIKCPVVLCQTCRMDLRFHCGVSWATVTVESMEDDGDDYIKECIGQYCPWCIRWGRVPRLIYDLEYRREKRRALLSEESAAKRVRLDAKS